MIAHYILLNFKHNFECSVVRKLIFEYKMFHVNKKGSQKFFESKLNE